MYSTEYILFPETIVAGCSVPYIQEKEYSSSGSDWQEQSKTNATMAQPGHASRQSLGSLTQVSKRLLCSTYEPGTPINKTNQASPTPHIYNAIFGCATWFHITNSTSNNLPSNAEFCRVMKFGSTIHCRAPISQTSAENQQIQTAITTSFSEYIATQPAHVQRILGNLQTTEMDVDYWKSAINARSAMIATGGSIADRN
eukprot:2438980-Ditylum_brightwellii.AAC.1